MRFVLKYPTRGRPTQFIRMVHLYQSLLSRQNPARFVVSIDEDDATMRTPDVRNFLRRARNVEVYAGKSTGKIAAVNADMDKLGDYDVLILMSDDMVPQRKSYDVVIEQLMRQHFPNLDGCLHFSDGLNNNNLNTMPIMGRKLVDKWGYIYHPSYKAEWCDNEFQAVTERDSKVVRVNQVLFKHEWTKATGRDATYKRNEGFWDHDKANFEQRKAAGFP